MSNQTLLKELQAELNDIKSLTRAEFQMGDLPDNTQIYVRTDYMPAIENVCRSCGSKVIGLCDCRFGE